MSVNSQLEAYLQSLEIFQQKIFCLFVEKIKKEQFALIGVMFDQLPLIFISLLRKVWVAFKLGSGIGYPVLWPMIGMKWGKIVSAGSSFKNLDRSRKVLTAFKLPIIQII